MRTNRLKERMKERPVALNGWLASGGTAAVDTMASGSWDAITIDMQHGMGDFETVVHALRAISMTPITPMVRVPWLEPGIIQRVLDAGSYGVICPMINTRAQCEAFVSTCRYAPRGTRSFGPIRASLYGGADYWKHANDHILALAMIETREALDNLDDILAVEELDGIYIGPADLSLSFGIDVEPSAGLSHPQLQALVETIRSRASAAGKYTLLHCPAVEQAVAMRDKGFSMLTIGNDLKLLAMGQQAAFQQVRGTAQAASGQGAHSGY